MKRALFFFFWVLCAIPAYSQSSTGLVAHWDMNGTVNDVSGNGHNGNANFLTAAPGMSGLPNTAYYFNGTSSYISVPYSPAFNLTKFSICATLKVAGFYSNYCQGNTVIILGAILGTGSWGLTFDDNAFNDCAVLDTTREVFNGKAGTNEPSLASDWQYFPSISESKWYKVVMTYDSISWRIYVNDTLVNTVTGPDYPIGVSTDSVSIGIDLGDSPTYPFQYYGLIDDIELYNLVLTDSEIVHYGATLGVNNVLNNATISIYPNPATTELTIADNDKITSVAITNLPGQTVFSHAYNAEQVRVNIAELPAGIYFVKVNGSEVRKLAKE